MKNYLQLLLAVMAVVAVSLMAPVQAQDPTAMPVAYSFEAVTMDATAGGIGFTASTLTVQGQQMRFCEGVVETAVVRYRVDGLGAPTALVGRLTTVGEKVRVDGFTNLTRFRGFRTTGTSGVIQFTCYR